MKSANAPHPSGAFFNRRSGIAAATKGPRVLPSPASRRRVFFGRLRVAVEFAGRTAGGGAGGSSNSSLRPWPRSSANTSGKARFFLKRGPADRPVMGFTVHPSQDRASARRIVRCEHLAKAHSVVAAPPRRKRSIAPGGWCWTWIAPRARSTASRRRALTADGVTSRTVLPALRTPNSDSGLRY